MKTKRGLSMPQEFTGWFIWGVIVLVFVIMIILVLKGQLTGGLDYFKSLMRFGRG